MSTKPQTARDSLLDDVSLACTTNISYLFATANPQDETKFLINCCASKTFLYNLAPALLLYLGQENEFLRPLVEDFVEDLRLVLYGPSVAEKELN